MNRNNSFIIIIIAVLALMCICVCGAGILTFGFTGKLMQIARVTDPKKIETLAAGIADYDIPPGYDQAGVNLLGIYRGITLTNSQDARQTILMMQVPSFMGMNAQEFELQLQRMLESQSNGNGIAWQASGVLDATIRGQPVEMTIRNGASQSGDKFKNASGIFEGRSGPVILMINAPDNLWNQVEIESFLKSIR